MQRELLHPQISDLADVERILVTAVDGVDEVELLRQAPGAESAASPALASSTSMTQGSDRPIIQDGKSMR